MKVHLSKKRNDGLIFDLEVSPIQMWGYPPLYETRALWVDQEQYLMSFAYRWESEKKTHYLDLRDSQTYGVDPTHDGELTKALYELWEHAAWAMAYNGDRFDLKMARTFFIRHGLIPKKMRSIDPIKMVKKEFKFSSNSMKNVAHELGVAPKMEVALGDLTKQIIKHDDRKAWKLFKEYNIQDVDTLYEIWLKVRPYATTHINMAMYADDYDACPRCGLRTMKRYKYQYDRTNAQTYRVYYCQLKAGGCGYRSSRMRKSQPTTKTRFV